MPMTSPGKGVEQEHAEQRRHGGDEVGPGGLAVDAPEPLGVQRIEATDGGDVDELDDGGDDDGGQRRLGQVLEQAGEEQQRDDGQHGDDEPGHLRPGTGGTVHRRLRQAAVDDHPRGQPTAEVRRAESDQLAVGVDLVVRPRGVRLRCAETLGEADEHDAGGRRGRGEVVAEADAVGRAERRQAAVDLSDDGDALVGEVEQVDGDHADDDGDERAGHDGCVAPQGDHDDERHHADDQRPGVRVAEVAEEAPELLEEVALTRARTRTAWGAGR